MPPTLFIADDDDPMWNA